MPVNSSARRRYRQGTKRSPCRKLVKKQCTSKRICKLTKKSEKRKSYCRLKRARKNTISKSNSFTALSNSSKSTGSFYNNFRDVPSVSPKK